MDPSLPSPSASRPLLSWLALGLVAILAAGGAFWLNQKIDSVQAAAAPRQESVINETQQAIASVKQAIAEIKTAQQNLGEQVSQLQRAVAMNQGERKLLSDQLGAVSSRIDALASSSAEAGSAPQQQSQSTNRRRR
ncbi:hypothetical protein LRP30_27670 [Bradyrhizobium sp. C-145]|uniref:hypothetical protein n=1 Tax=Bradyrhizobium sp. C-145 TaxID=574727 RepID=UPI00201B5493|nr:hypothetical protein [Bradyrhizobium sp. C-145]UQR60763.1 hypothetical protein LRP30_27670 [Bradyrhizobium sp. C-145]